MKVRVRNPQHGRVGVWHFQQPEYFEYEGEEVRLRHVSAEELALTTGNSEWPVRVIQRQLIIAMDGSPVTVSPSSNQVRRVKGSKGNEYTVALQAGRWTCSCPGFQFRNSCKHTVV